MSLADKFEGHIGPLRSLLARAGATSPIAHGALVAALSCAGIWLSELMLKPLVSYAPEVGICWPTDGILLAIVLMCPRKAWLWIGLGYVAADSITHNWDPAGIAIDCLCNLFEIFFAAFFIPAFTDLGSWILRPGLLLRFTTFAVVLSPLCAALVGGFYFRDHTPHSYWIVVLHWETGDALGIALWTPLVLCLWSKDTYQIFRPARLRSTLLLFTFFLGPCWYIFHQRAYPVAFIALPILVVIVNLLGFPGAVLAVNALTIISAAATLHGNGPFQFMQGAQAPYRIVALQIYLTLSMLMCFTIALTRLQRESVETRLKVALRQMELVATRDGLTGLGNRRIFDTTLKTEWSRARREGTSIALLLLDADCFKSYNDLYGHLAGDDCLRQIAESLSLCVQRPGDLIARYGGEEFVVLLGGTTLDQAVGIAETIRAHIEARQIVHSGNPHSVVTVSVGCCAASPRTNLTPVTLVHHADQALYQAKQIGRNRVEWHTTVLREAIEVQNVT